MKERSTMQTLLLQNRWEDYQPLMDSLHNWSFWSYFETALATLKRDALFTSRVHGQGHIERTLLHGAFCAMDDKLSLEDTCLLLDACSYHDVGRVSDWYDLEHGYRSSLKIEALTGRSGDHLIMLKAIVDAHARPDNVLESTLQLYHPADYSRTLRLAQLLKDADGLDRVRIHDLNTKFLRRAASVARADFAQYLFDRYEAVNSENTHS